MILYNEKQLECIEHPPAPLMIIAGAGTGKTTTLIGRIAYFINERNISPENILVLTYTVKAAEHLKNNIPNLVQSSADKINASNFHSFALAKITAYHEVLGYSILPTFIEPSEVKCILKEIIYANIDILESSNYKKDINLANVNVPKMFDRFRDELILEDELIEKRDAIIANKENEENDLQLLDCINLFFKYQNFKKKKSWIDFGDMIIDLWTLVNNQKALIDIQSSIKHILVDEYQDNNFALSQIIMKLSGENGSVTVVGDDDQSIYSFRGANVIAFNEFRNHYESFDNYSEIILDVNYRSPQSILNFANQTVKSNSFRIKETPLISNKEINNDVVLYSGDRSLQLAKMLSMTRRYLSEGVKPSEICILTRSRTNAIDVSNYFNQFSIKNSYKSGKLFDSEVGKDFMAFINIMYRNIYMEAAIYRLILKSKSSHLLAQTDSMSQIKEELSIEKESKEEILQYLKDSRNKKTKDSIKLFSDFSKVYLNNPPPLEALNMISKMIDRYKSTYMDTLEGNLCDYLNYMFQLNDTLLGESPPSDEAISIMTIHQSKGMEFDYVIIPFLASQTFPITKGKSAHLDDIPDKWVRNVELLELDKIEEERRVFHVAATRAKKRLSLLAPIKRRSKFFKEIDSSSYLEVELVDEKKVEEKKVEYLFKYENSIDMQYSATSLSLYERCPLSFKLNKIDKISEKGYSPAASFGLHVHKALENIFLEGVTDRGEIENLVSEIWNERRFENIYQSAEYEKETIDLIYNYMQYNSPELSTKYYFEESIRITHGESVFYGKLDRIDVTSDGKVRVLDYKTSKSKKNSRYAKKDIQLAFYSFLIKNSTNLDFEEKIPDTCTLEFVRDFKDPSVDVAFESADMIDLTYRIRNIVDAIKKNEFSPKKNVNCFFCEYKKLLCPLYK